MATGSSRFRSVSVRIVAIALAGAFGIAAIAGSAVYLGLHTSAALRGHAEAARLDQKAGEIDRLYAAARRDLGDFLRLQQTRPAESFGQRMQTIALGADALAASADRQTVGRAATQLRDLARQAVAEVASLATQVVAIGVGPDSGLLGQSTRTGEQLEQMAVEIAQTYAGPGAWRLTYGAAAIRRHEHAYEARREEHRLGGMEGDVSRFERQLAAFPDEEIRTRLGRALIEHRAAFEHWREADTRFIGSVERLDEQLFLAVPLVDELRKAAAAKVAAASETLARAQGALMDFIAGMGGGALLASIGIALAVGRSVTAPLGRLKLAMQDLANGSTGAPVPETGRRDEIGDMARMVEVFRANAIERGRLAAAHDAEQSTRLERAAAVESLIVSFRDGMGETIHSVTLAVENLNAVSAALSEAAGTTIWQSGLASAAVEEAAQNVGMVSSGTTQLTASIAEIAARAAESNGVAQQALATANQTLQTMRGLERSALSIGEVVDLIRSIAQQTNLLALNATIEAARAGEAGRGFSVVASEVKALASQTARATDDIARQVAAIQNASGEAGQALASVNGIIETLSSLAGSVASAVEEQSAAVESIASNIVVAADKTRGGFQAMGTVAEATRQTEAVAGEVAALSRKLSAEAATVESRIASFIQGVRAA